MTTRARIELLLRQVTARLTRQARVVRASSDLQVVVRAAAFYLFASAILLGAAATVALAIRVFLAVKGG